MSKISNPAGAVRVLRSTMAKMAAEYKALERRLARVTATKDREFDARVKLESNLADERVISGVFRADICEAIHALVGSYPPHEPDARTLGAAMLDFVRGAMRTAEHQNIETANLRARILDLETGQHEAAKALQARVHELEERIQLERDVNALNGDAIMEARDTIQRFTGVHATFFDDAVRIGISHAALRGIAVQRGSGDPRRYMREIGA